LVKNEEECWLVVELDADWLLSLVSANQMGPLVSWMLIG
jgi:hypothetical protein